MAIFIAPYAKEIVVINSEKEDEIAVELTCQLLTAALAIDILRSENRRDKIEPVRAYLFREKWAKLPSHAVLTVEHRGMIVLNSIYFPRIVGVQESTPLAPKKMTFGG